MLFPSNNAIFHVHTYRCGHAGDEPDSAYVERAIGMGADEIWFADHTPFPGDPFRNRMKYEELGRYCSDLAALREKYQPDISIKIGLEIEYLPAFADYYAELAALRESGKLDFLLLGQHFYQAGGKYSFDLPEGKGENEVRGLAEAIISGMMSGQFDALAHPDRIFRRCKRWTEEMSDISHYIIAGSAALGLSLELNYKSEETKRHYWPEFWDLLPLCSHMVIHGCDAHSPAEMRKNIVDESW